MRDLWTLLTCTYAEWSADRAARLAAALAFYTTLSLAPLLLVVISVGGLIFGAEAVRGELMRQIAVLTGPQGAAAIQDLLANASQPAEGLIATAIGLATLLFGAAGVTWELKEALNKIWDVPEAAATALQTLRSYVVSLGLVLGVGFVLVVSLVLSAALAAFNAYLSSKLQGTEILWMAVNFAASLAALTLSFALMFKLLPDIPVKLSDVWIGALATAAFFEAGKFAVGLYLGWASVASAYGAAGSFVVVLLWIYYAAQIFFFGAELTHTYAKMAEERRVRRTVALSDPLGRTQPLRS